MKGVRKVKRRERSRNGKPWVEYSITLPLEMMEELGWSKGEPVAFRRLPRGVAIEEVRAIDIGLAT